MNDDTIALVAREGLSSLSGKVTLEDIYQKKQTKIGLFTTPIPEYVVETHAWRHLSGSPRKEHRRNDFI